MPAVPWYFNHLYVLTIIVALYIGTYIVVIFGGSPGPQSVTAVTTSRAVERKLKHMLGLHYVHVD